MLRCAAILYHLGGAQLRDSYGFVVAHFPSNCQVGGALGYPSFRFKKEWRKFAERLGRPLREKQSGSRPDGAGRHHGGNHSDDSCPRRAEIAENVGRSNKGRLSAVDSRCHSTRNPIFPPPPHGSTKGGCPPMGDEIQGNLGQRRSAQWNINPPYLSEGPDVQKNTPCLAALSTNRAAMIVGKECENVGPTGLR